MPCHRAHFTPRKTCQRFTLDGKGAKIARLTFADRSSFGSQTNYGEITRKSPRCQANIRTVCITIHLACGPRTTIPQGKDCILLRDVLYH